MHMPGSSWVGCPATFAYWIIVRVENVEDFKWFQKQLSFHLLLKAADEIEWNKQGLCASWRASVQMFRCIHYMVTRTQIMPINCNAFLLLK